MPAVMMNSLSINSLVPRLSPRERKMQWKAGQGLGMRLPFYVTYYKLQEATIDYYTTGKEGHSATSCQGFRSTTTISDPQQGKEISMAFLFNLQSHTN